ncbi:hypothetical protein MNEG_1933 [Monoraphidium neglectum]|uniref:Sodium/bile acid cotransporter 7 n=1 Tax=Monoraphidium neglectum TaxID=145388 RepID=A0A0D2NND0_9CHLO|nr:hypothetical protein MNEG_1933 [Monoraphidium neglectum]KIZ06026.1 hypothetical protein MNEG_1933 [Monoraphidium neglectum]|eukprot:XP_013905045.1 hypothetical protein MNEG_1933 [Monoraphidium neglectum]
MGAGNKENAERIPEWKRVLGLLSGFVVTNYLVVAFVVAFTIAMAWPLPGAKVLEPQVVGVHIITFINICIVFFISGLTLRTDELKTALTRRNALGTTWGFISIVGVTPLLAFAVRDLPFTPPEYATGLALFCIVPTTLGVGVSLVTSAKGNVALAILLTVASNVLGVVVIPGWLQATLRVGKGGVEDLRINFVDIFVKLLLSFFVPTAIGKGLRELSPPARRFAQAHKQALGIISNTNLALLIWQTLSSAQEIIVNTSFGTMLCVIVGTFLVHILYLVFNTLVVLLLRLPVSEAASIVIMASQKSAPVAVTVITYIASNTQTQGLLAVPCVTGQLVQIFVGQPLANYLAGRILRARQEQEAQLALKEEPQAGEAPTGASDGLVVLEGGKDVEAGAK